jgi:chorismate mutase
MSDAMKSRFHRLRSAIDVADRSLVRLLARRLRLVDKLRPFKSCLRDSARERVVIDNVLKEATQRRVDRVFIRTVYEALLRASRRHQRRG